jgi:cation:H+ antiporter
VWDVLFLALGLGGLWLGTGVAVSATSALGRRRGLSPVFLGLTVLAVGTDLPEFIVALDGALLQFRGVDAAGVIVGNAVGSAIAQGSVVLGAAAMLGSIDLSAARVRRDGVVLILATGLLAFLSADGKVSRAEGLSMAAAYAIYLAVLLRGAGARDEAAASWGSEDAHDCMRIAGGLVVVLLSAEIVLDHAIALSSMLDLSQTVVGVVFVGAGTSVPELGLSIRAAAKGEPALAVGNVVGSNIFDVLVPIGTSAMIHPLRVDWETLAFDLPILVVVSVLILVWAARGSQLGWTHAGVLFCVYVLYAGCRLTL